MSRYAKSVIAATPPAPNGFSPSVNPSSTRTAPESQQTHGANCSAPKPKEKES